MASGRPLKEPRLITCPGCGGTWFREANFYQFDPEERFSCWDTWPDLVGQKTIALMTVAVCLCGLPQRPNIGGIRGGRTPNQELNQLMESLEAAQKSLDGRVLSQAAKHGRVKLGEASALELRLKTIEKLVGRQLAKANPNRSARGRHWVPPERVPASGKDGTLTRDKLVRALQERGFLFRQAREIVTVIFKRMIRELQDGGEVALKQLLGRFRVVHRGRPPRELRRLGRVVTVNQNSRRVAFRLDPRVRTALRSQPQQEETKLPTLRNPGQLRCDKCGSIEFVEAHFKQYQADFASSSPGGGLVPLTEQPLRTLVCLCGHPVMPGAMRRLAGPPGRSAWASFRKSFDAAIRYRESVLPQGLSVLQERFASRKQQKSLASRLDNLERIVEELRRDE